MELDSLTGIWAGTAHNSNDWDMEITISITDAVQVGSTLGTYTIPEIPCSGIFRVMEIRGETLHLKAEDQQGECGEADSDTLELLPDDTLLYNSKGEGWEARGILERASG
ncbi:MAG TPA: hypothetical protein VMJ90_06070 [Anaerolineales bacterium]|nr:hypothetical protein [Anaerolineales bacterium]